MYSFYFNKANEKEFNAKEFLLLVIYIGGVREIKMLKMFKSNYLMSTFISDLFFIYLEILKSKYLELVKRRVFILLVGIIKPFNEKTKNIRKENILKYVQQWTNCNEIIAFNFCDDFHYYSVYFNVVAFKKNKAFCNFHIIESYKDDSSAKLNALIDLYTTNIENQKLKDSIIEICIDLIETLYCTFYKEEKNFKEEAKVFRFINNYFVIQSNGTNCGFYVIEWLRYIVFNDYSIIDDRFKEDTGGNLIGFYNKSLNTVTFSKSFELFIQYNDSNSLGFDCKCCNEGIELTWKEIDESIIYINNKDVNFLYFKAGLLFNNGLILKLIFNEE
ncbi:hypothetical protein ABK040_014407 [Willaertia magna]